MLRFNIHPLGVGGLALLLLFSPSANAQLFPDKEIASIGDWHISTAMYGVGCVADKTYDYDKELWLFISGETTDNLILVVTVDSKRFETPLDGSVEELAGQIEIALARKRWGGVEPYGFRGTPGIVFRNIGSDFIHQFKTSKRLKVTEMGREKLSIPLGDTTNVMDKLFKCFDDQ